MGSNFAIALSNTPATTATTDLENFMQMLDAAGTPYELVAVGGYFSTASNDGRGFTAVQVTLAEQPLVTILERTTTVVQHIYDETGAFIGIFCR